MSKLWLKLTPFAPDSSGALSILYGLKALAVSYDPQGCLNNYRHNDEPRWRIQKQPFYSAVLAEREIVLGKEALLIKQCCELLEKEKPALFALLGGPIAMLIGSDLEALCQEIQQQTGVPSIGIGTTGQKFYDVGASMAMLALGKMLIEPASSVREKTVNIVGATIFEFPNADSLKDLTDYVERQGLKVLSVWGISSPIEVLRKAASAQLNLVVSVSGFALAKWMQGVLGIPYVIFAPIGESAQKDFFIRTEIENSNNADCLGIADRPRVLIVGEQIMANGLRHCLEREFQINNVQVAGFFMMEKDILRTGDKQLYCEADLEDLLEENKYDIVIGDPLLQRLVSEESLLEFWSLPQPAISGQFFLRERSSLIGERASEWIKGQMGKVKKQ